MVINAHRRRDVRRAMRLRVKLDGVLVPRCYYADGRRGVIREFVEDERGQIVVVADVPDRTEGHALKRERRGRVTWVRMPWGGNI